MQLNPEDMGTVLNRLRRAHGQLGGIVTMIEDGRECEDVVTQLAAVGKAIDRAAFSMITTTLKACLTEQAENPGSTSLDLAKLEKLFLSLA